MGMASVDHVSMAFDSKEGNNKIFEVENPNPDKLGYKSQNVFLLQEEITLIKPLNQSVFCLSLINR